MEIFIYILIDPVTGHVRYVGKTVSPKSRLRGHRWCAKGKDHKSNWINSLKLVGMKPIMEVVEMVESSIWQAREAHWIAWFKSLGSPLTNLDSGGTTGQNRHHPETIQKIISSNLGKKRSAETRERNRISHLGMKPPALAVERSVAKTRGIPRPPEVIEKIKSSHAKRIISDEERVRLRTQNLGRKASPETRLKLSISHRGSRGYHHSQETIEKIRKSNLKHHI